MMEKIETMDYRKLKKKMSILEDFESPSNRISLMPLSKNVKFEKVI